MRRTLYHFYLWAADRINDAGPLMMHECTGQVDTTNSPSLLFPLHQVGLQSREQVVGEEVSRKRSCERINRDPGSVVIPNRKLFLQKYICETCYLFSMKVC